MGLGHFGGGIAVAKYLLRQGASVLATDAKPRAELPDEVDALEAAGVALRLGEHRQEDFEQADLVVASPAVPPKHELLSAAKRRNVKVTTEMSLLVERLPTKLVFGVTGTKGKSTTATLLAKMLGAWRPMEGERAAKVRATRSPHIDLIAPTPRRVWLGGNLGGSLLDSIEQIKPLDFVVLELSSYMLHYLGERRWSPHVAVVTMIGTDHLAWHGGRDAYVAAKQNIVRFQKETDFAVLPTGYADARKFKDHTAARVVEYGKRAHLPEAFAPKLPGKHNRINERGAYAAAAVVGVYPDQAAAACEEFAGLPHRLELVHEADGVRWVNDSIATIPEAAVAACTAFAADTVIQIVGGSDKGLDTSEMAEVLAKRCKRVLCIGAMGQAVAEQVGEKAEVVETMERAVPRARELATECDVVLMSPGFASYDQFVNFERRGEAFVRLAADVA